MADTRITPNAGSALLSTKVVISTPLAAALLGVGQAAQISTGSGSTTLTPLKGTLTATTLGPGVLLQNFATPNAGLLAMAGQLAAARPSLTPATAALALVGLSPLGSPSAILTPITGALTLSRGMLLTPSTGAVTADGVVAQIARGPLTPGVGSLTIAGVLAVMGLPIGTLRPNTASLVFGDQIANTSLTPGTAALFFGTTIARTLSAGT